MYARKHYYLNHLEYNIFYAKHKVILIFCSFIFLCLSYIYTYTNFMEVKYILKYLPQITYR